jgi:hypothetical protein
MREPDTRSPVVGSRFQGSFFGGIVLISDTAETGGYGSFSEVDVDPVPGDGYDLLLLETGAGRSTQRPCHAADGARRRQRASFGTASYHVFVKQETPKMEALLKWILVIQFLQLGVGTAIAFSGGIGVPWIFSGVMAMLTLNVKREGHAWTIWLYRSSVFLNGSGVVLGLISFEEKHGGQWWAAWLFGLGMMGFVVLAALMEVYLARPLKPSVSGEAKQEVSPTVR